MAHALVDTEVQELHDHALAVLGPVVQKAGELTLGEDHAAREMIEGQPEELCDRGRELEGPPRKHLPPALEHRFLGRRVPLAKLPDHSHGAVLTLAEGEIEADLGLELSVADHR